MAIRKFAELMWKGEEIPLYGDGETKRDFTYIDDVVTGFVGCLSLTRRFEIINLGTSGATTLRRLVALLEEALGKRARIRFLAPQPGEMLVTMADIKLAQELLGYRPATLIEDGIEKFAHWFIRNHT
jgi:UDP-glucuronate 4-epimerase